MEWCWSWNSSTLATSCEELTHWKRLWCWEGLGAGGEENDRAGNGWMATLTQWMWVWVNSGSWWWTGRPGVLQFMVSQRVGHDWVNWTDKEYSVVERTWNIWEQDFNICLVTPQAHDHGKSSEPQFPHLYNRDYNNNATPKLVRNVIWHNGRNESEIASLSVQLYLTLSNPRDCSLPPEASVHEILQSRILE